MAQPRMPWGQHSKAYRDRVAKQAFDSFGLSRRSVREMYNRGTYRPSAKDPAQRIPRKVAQQRSYTEKGGLSDAQIRAQIVANYDAQIKKNPKYTSNARARLAARLDTLSGAKLRRMAAAVANDARDNAKFQSRDIKNGTAPRIVMDLAYPDPDDEGEYINPFWYH